MKQQSILPVHFWLVACLLGVTGGLQPASAAEHLAVRVQLIWGTNDPKSPDPKHTAIEADLSAKLKNSPYKWKNYFEVNRQALLVPLNETKAAQMSDRCKLEIKNLGGDRVEVKLYGQGKCLFTNKEKLAADWPLIYGGDAKNDTAWMVVVKKVPPAAAAPPKPK